MQAPCIWMDGRVVPLAEAQVSVLAPTLHYGPGVFEGIRSYQTDHGPRIFRLGAHLDRMARGAEAIGLPFDRAACAEACEAVLAESGLGDAYLRPLAYFGGGALGLDVAGYEANLMVAILPWRNHLGDASVAGVRAHVSPFRRNPAAALPPLKLCGNYVNSILAKRRATQEGYDEALFVDEHGQVVEATGENVFMVQGGVVTAVAHPDALPGITREVLLELSGGRSRPVTLAELLEADEVFLTGTSAEVAPLAALEGRTWQPGPVTLALREAYLDLVRERVPAGMRG